MSEIQNNLDGQITDNYTGRTMIECQFEYQFHEN